MYFQHSFETTRMSTAVEVQVGGTPGIIAPVGSVQKQRVSHQETSRPPALGNGKQSSC